MTPRDYARLTPLITRDETVWVAEEVIAGDVRMATWPHALACLALGVALAELDRPAPEAAAVEAPVPPTGRAGAAEPVLAEAVPA